MGRSRIPEAKGNHAHDITSRQSRDLAEVEVEGKNDSPLTSSQPEDLAVRQALKAQFAQVRRIEPRSRSQRMTRIETPMSPGKRIAAT